MKAAAAYTIYPMLAHTLLIFAWLIGLVYATIPVYWLAVHPFANRWAARKGKVFPILGLIWLAIICAAGAITSRWKAETIYSTLWSLLPGGVLVALDFYLLRRIGKGFGRDRLIGKNELHPEQHEQKLITTGMHARMRHPIYLAHLIMLTALSVASGLLVMYALLAFAIVTGAFMIRAEDAELESGLGRSTASIGSACRRLGYFEKQINRPFDSPQQQRLAQGDRFEIHDKYCRVIEILAAKTAAQDDNQERESRLTD